MKLKLLMASLDREGFLTCINLASFSCSARDSRTGCLRCARSLPRRVCVCVCVCVHLGVSAYARSLSASAAHALECEGSSSWGVFSDRLLESSPQTVCLLLSLLMRFRHMLVIHVAFSGTFGP